MYYRSVLETMYIIYLILVFHIVAVGYSHARTTLFIILICANIFSLHYMLSVKFIVFYLSVDVSNCVSLVSCFSKWYSQTC